MKKIVLIILIANFGVIFGGILKNSNYQETFVVEATDCPGGSVDSCTQICIDGCGGSSDPATCTGGCYNACVDICSGGSGNNCGNGVCDAPGETSNNCSQDCGGGSSDSGSDDGGSDDGGSDGGSSSGGGTSSGDCHNSGAPCLSAGGSCTVGGRLECSSGVCCANDGTNNTNDPGTCSSMDDVCPPTGVNNDNDVDQEEDDNQTNSQADGLCNGNLNDPDCDNIGISMPDQTQLNAMTSLTSGDTNCSSLCNSSNFKNRIVTACGAGTSVNVNFSSVSGNQVNCHMNVDGQNRDITLNCDGSNLTSINYSNMCTDTSDEDESNDTQEDTSTPETVSVPLSQSACTQQEFADAASNSNGYFSLNAVDGVDDTVTFVCRKDQGTNIYRCGSGESLHYNSTLGSYSCTSSSSNDSSSEDTEEDNESESGGDTNSSDVCTAAQQTKINGGYCYTSSQIVTVGANAEKCRMSAGGSQFAYCCEQSGQAVTVSGSTVSCPDNESSLINKIKAISIISKANAQSLPDTINPDQLDSGEYTIDPIGYESAVFDIYEDETRVRYFVDLNGNGRRNANEPFINTATLTINITKTKEARKYKLNAGWNLIGFSFVNEDISKASELVGKLAQQGIITYQVAKYDSGNWINFVARVKANGELQTYGTDFNFVPGEGYFIRIKRGGEAILRGNLFTESVPVNLKRGWNLRSVQSVTKYTAQSFMENCIDHDINCKTISKFVNGLYETVTKQNGKYFGENFPLKKNEGYFILNRGQNGQFTP